MMKRKGVAERLAKYAGIPTPVAADQVDRMVHHILKRLRKGKSVSVPGLGEFIPELRKGFRLETTDDPEKR